MDPVIGLYENLKKAYKQSNYEAFNLTASQIKEIGIRRGGNETSTLIFEKTYNGFESFYRSMIAYILIFIIACITSNASDDKY